MADIGSREDDPRQRLLGNGITSSGDAAPTDVPPSCTTRLAFSLLSIFVCVYFFSYALCIPIANFYIFDQVGKWYGGGNISSMSPCISNITNGTEHETEIRIQKEASTLTLYLECAWFLPGLVPILFLGPIIDRAGRKIGFITPMVGTFLKQIVYFIVIYGNFSVYILFLGNVIEGFSGGFGTMLMVAFGITADLTPPNKQRAFRISLIEATQAISASVSVFCVGFWMKHFGYLYPVILAGGLSILNIIFTVLLMPETLQNRVNIDLCQTIKNIKKCFTFYVTDTPEKRRGKLRIEIVAFFLTVAVNFSKPGIQNLFYLKRPLCWDELKINIFTSCQIIGTWLVILMVMKIIQRFLKWKDTILALIGSASSGAACCMMAFAYTDGMVYGVAVTGVFTRMIIPMIRSAMSKSVLQEEQGALFAGMGCIEMVCAAGMGALATLLYKSTVGLFDGTAFLTMAAVMVLVFILLLILNITTHRDRRSGYAPIN